MRQLTPQAKMETLELYVKGFSTNGIVAKTGISKGAVVSIIKDAREGKFPHLELKDKIDDLHELSVRLKKQDLNLSQAKLGLIFVERLWGLGIEPDKVEAWLGFCSALAPEPPPGFIAAAMELYQAEKETGMSYSELASQAKQLSAEREGLLKEVDDLKAKEARAIQLKQEIEENQGRVETLKADREHLEKEVTSLNEFLQRKAGELGIPFPELEARLGEPFSIEEELVQKRKEKNRLEGELQALTEREQKLSSRIEKAATDFERDLKLLSETMKELVRIGAMKGRYEKEMEYMEWGKRVLPFLSDPEKVPDDDLSLTAIVVNCLDRWIQAQPGWRYHSHSLSWEEVKKDVHSRRMQIGRSSS